MVKLSMLIEDNKFNLEEFKKRYTSFDWKRYPRTLGPDHEDYFYIGIFEDSDWKIKIKTRPSMRMSISESYKHCDKNGNKIDPNSKVKFEFGQHVEVVIDENFLNKLKEISKDCGNNGTQKVSW